MALSKDIGRTEWNPAWRLYKHILDHEADPPHTRDLAQFMGLERANVHTLLKFLKDHNLVTHKRTYPNKIAQRFGVEDPADVGSRWTALRISSDEPFPVQPSVRKRLIKDPPPGFRDDDEGHDY